MKIRVSCAVVFLVLALSSTLFSQKNPGTTFIPAGSSIFVEEMGDDLDGYVRAELVKKKVPLNIVLNRAEAHVVLTGEAAASKRSWTEGWLTTPKDHATGSAMIIDRSTKKLLWAGEAGDRSLWWGDLSRGGPRKVASRLADQINKVIRAVPQGSLPPPPPLTDEERLLDARPLPTPPPPGPDTIQRSAGSDPTAVTNEDVLKLLSAQIGEDVILAKIKSSPSKFRLDTDSLIELKKAGASDRIITAMMEGSR